MHHKMLYCHRYIHSWFIFPTFREHLWQRFLSQPCLYGTIHPIQFRHILNGKIPKRVKSSYTNYLAKSQETQITKLMGPTWGPPGSCRPQMGPMLAPWTLLSGNIPNHLSHRHRWSYMHECPRQKQVYLLHRGWSVWSNQLCIPLI